MERRDILKGAFALFGASALGVALTTGSAEAAPLELPVPEPETLADEQREEASDLNAPDAEGQYYFRRRRRFYRPRRMYYRPRRRVYYYRPRRVYYRRPRRVYYRRIYW